MMSASALSAADAALGPDRVKILAVDDDSDNLLALQAVLDPLNEEVILAKSGLEALRLCLDYDFAAILLDVRMPEMDGFETAEMIRSRQRSTHTPILFLTAYRNDEQLFRGYDLGAVDFLFKPIVPEILQSKVKVFVQLSRSERLLRYRAEELTRTEKQFRAVLEAAPDAMVITDADGRIELANSRTDLFFGHSRQSLLGLNVRLLIPEWTCPPLDLGDSTAWPCFETRVAGVRSDGTSFPAQITRSAFGSHERPHVTTAIRDATDQVDSETRIKRANAELERRVAERTAALSYSNEALRQFAWAASHDLQEPIRAVVNYSQWLGETLDGRLGEMEDRMLTTIQQHAGRLNQLLEGLRRYIHISDSGHHEWKEIDFGEALKMALFNIQELITASDALIECPPLPRLRAFETPVIQLFQNLIGNAIKYRSEERPRIKISAEEGQKEWIFSVADNGIGIDSKYFDYIFGVFRRLHGPERSGTGIGLALCRAAVERLGGRIWVESTPGMGSCFYFQIPKITIQEQGE